MEASFDATMLTGPTASEHAAVVEIANDLVTSITPLVGGSAPSIRALGNESNMVRLRCTRRYTTLLAAMDARATFTSSLSRTGTLLLTQISGGSTLTITGLNAVRMSSQPPVLAGRQVTFSFVIAVKTLTAATA